MGIRVSLVLSITTLVCASGWSAQTTRAQFGLNFSNFISASEPYFGSEYNAKSLSTAALQFQFQGGTGSEERRVDLATFYSFVEDESYIVLPEAYYDFGGRSEDLILGRKKYDWSEADEVWQTGLWQPRFNWDRMRPQSLGFVGGFWAKSYAKRDIKVFVSPLFIPDEGVKFQESGGRLISKNPWFRPPPPSGEVLGAETDIYSKVEIPETSEVLFNPGFGFRLDEKVSDTQTLGLAYAFKPINQILNAFSYRFRAAEQGGGVDLNFFPWVGYHNLITSDWSYRDRVYQHGLSVTYEAPTGLLKDPNLNYQQLRDTYTVSWISRWNLRGEGPSALQVYGGYLRQWGGFAGDGGDAISEGTQFELRGRYVNVAKLGLTYPLWTKYRRLVNSLEMNYDMELNGGTLLSQVEYLVNDEWVMNFNVDLIGVIDPIEGPYANNWINAYRANDKVSMGMTYVY